MTLRTLERLPSATRFAELCVATAALDAVLMPDWELRYFSFDSKWDKGERMASLRDGSGGEQFALFTGKGVFVKGFEPDSALNALPQGAKQDWRTVGVPSELRAALTEPAFDMENLSFCIWCTAKAGSWACGQPPPSLLDEPLGRLHLLLDDPKIYATWASDYYERSVPADAVERFYRLEPLNASMVHALNDEVELEDVVKDVKKAGYPLG